MSKVKVNYKSDIPPVAVQFKVNNVAQNLPDHDFAVRFFVDGDPGNSFICTCKYVEGVAAYTNCEKTSATTLTCYIDNHGFSCGRLCCEFIDLSPDEDYSDGIFKTVNPSPLDVYLVDGAGDDSLDVLQVVFSYAINEIASITQTTTSNESGGTNVITITQTGGSSSTVNVLNGKSAYQCYVATTTDNPVMTQAEWLASLKGENGAGGEDGADGEDGVDGVGFSSIVAHSPVDGSVDITLTNGDVITLNLNHTHVPSQVVKSVTSSSDATVTLSADVIYDLGTVAGNKTINLPTTVDAGAEYEFRLAYTSGTISGTAISGTTVANDATLTFTAGKTYQVIISGGILYFSETTTPS